MELKDFIKNTIKDISESIIEANEELKGIGTIVNPREVWTRNIDAGDNLYGHIPNDEKLKKYNRTVHSIDFDISVTSVIKNDGKEGIGVKIIGISLGKDNSNTVEDKSDNRLKFKLPVALPCHSLLTDKG